MTAQQCLKCRSEELRRVTEIVEKTEEELDEQIARLELIIRAQHRKTEAAGRKAQSAIDKL
jgi:hypothetical protein